ncbi:MAG: transcriptional repressor [Candidatus Wallbacteria bacterium]
MPEFEFLNYLKTLGLKITNQRKIIIEVLLKNHGRHLSLEQILSEAKKNNPKISLATVFRNINFLEKENLLTKMKLDDNKSYYELCLDFKGSKHTSTHHDHLICESCGIIIEFYNDEIEKLQKKIALDFNFKISRHKMELYGICGNCIKNGELK